MTPEIPESPNMPPDDPLGALRKALARPHNLDSLREWARFVRRAAKLVRDVNPTSPEANDALRMAAAAEDLFELYERLIKSRKELEKASDDPKEIQIPYRIKTTAISLKNQIETVQSTGRFQIERDELIDLAARLEKDAEELKKSLVAKDKRLVNVVTAVVSERYESALNDLYELEKNGVRHVIGDDDELKDIYPIIDDTRGKYIEHLKGKAGDHLTKARAALQKETDEGLANARSEHLQGERIIDNAKWVAEQLKKTNVADDLSALKQQIVTLYDHQKATNEFLDQALSADPAETLKGFNRLIYTWNRGRIERVRSDVEANFKKIWEQSVNDANQRAQRARQRRNYSDKPDSAEEILESCRAQITNLSPDLRGLLQDQIDALDGEINNVQDESALWDEFEKFKGEIENLLQNNRADEGTLKDIQVHISCDYPDGSSYQSFGRYFKRELEALKGRVLPVAGERVVLDQILALYLDNPADPQILVVANNARQQNLFRSTSKFFDELDTYLHLHQAHAVLLQARSKIADTVQLVSSPTNWEKLVDNHIQACTKHATHASVSDNDRRVLQEELNDLKKVKNHLLQVVNKINRLEAGNFAARCTLLNEEISKEEQNTSSSAARTAQILNALLLQTRSQWRDAGMTYLNNHVLNNHKVDITNLRSAGNTMAALRAEHALTQDGDDLRARNVQYLLGVREVEIVMQQIESGFDLGKSNGGQVAKLGSVIWNERQWSELLGHLDKIIYSELGEDVTVANANHLRVVVMAHFGLTGQRDEVIRKLNDELPTLRGLDGAGSIYVALVLRYLEKKTERPQARQLVLELTARTERLIRIADGLEKLITAHELHDQLEIDDAVNTLLSGQNELVQHLPELKESLVREIQQTTQNWFAAWVNRKLEKVQPVVNTIRTTRNCTVEQFFQVLDSLHQAQKYSQYDVRVADAERAIAQVSRQIAEALRADLEALMQDGSSLQEKTCRAAGYEGYYQILKQGWDRVKLTDANLHWKDVLDRFDELFDAEAGLKVKWDRALDEIHRLRKTYRKLFFAEEKIGAWNWNINPKTAPSLDISNMVVKRQLISSLLGEVYRPVELTALEDLLRNTRRCLEELDRDFKGLLQAIKDEDHAIALEKLNLLEAKVESWQSREFTEEEMTRALKEDAFVMRLEPFFQYPNPYRRMDKVHNEMGTWAESGTNETICGFIDIRKLVDSRMVNAQEWENWRLRAIQHMNSVRQYFRQAHEFLRRGELGEAINLCGDKSHLPTICGQGDPEGAGKRENLIPKAIDEIYQDRAALLSKTPPQTSHILNEIARPASDALDVYAEHTAKPKWDAAWDNLQRAPRYKLIRAWWELLTLEIILAMIDLGWTNETTPVLRKNWFTGDFNYRYQEIETIIHDADGPKRIPLEKHFEASIGELNRLCVDIDRLIDRHMKRKPAKWNTPALDMLRDLLMQAEKIDRNAEFVRRARAIYLQYRRPGE